LAKGSITLDCDACIAGKMTKKRSRRSRDKRYEAIASLIEWSTDTVCAGVKGVGGEQFYCSVCYHATSFVWTLCVCTKDRIAKKLVSLLRFEVKMNMLLTINKNDGKEVEGSLNEFLTEEGTHVRKVSRYDDAGNGRIESANCAMLDAVRTMYVVNCAVLVSNQLCCMESTSIQQC
jgi:hypothetical protein